MAENIIVQGDSKAELYETLCPQIDALIGNETDLVANMANVAAALRQTFGFFWVGFYRVQDEELLLGPFQGPVACTRIKHGQGVCGKAWANGKVVVVPDVNLFPGHIACNSASKSEIVVPLKRGNKVFGILDIDSDSLDSFDSTDALWLERICEKIQ